MLLLNQDVIRVVRRDWEYRNAGIGERLSQGCDDARKAIVQGTLALQDAPSRLARDAVRKVRFGTNDGHLIRCPRDRDKLPIGGPGRHVRIWVEPAYRIAIGKQSQC